MNTKTIKNFKQMLDVNTPIIYIQDYDFVRTDELIKTVLGNTTKILEWNPANKLIDFRQKEPYGMGDTKPLTALLTQMVSPNTNYHTPRFLVLRDIQDYLDETTSVYDPAVKTALQLIAQRKLYDRDFDLTIIIVSSVLKIPPEIEKYVSFLSVDFPTEAEIKQIINEHIEVNGYQDFKKEDAARLMPNLRGLTLFEIDRMLDIAMSRNGTLGGEDNKRILEHKKQMVKKSGILELVDTEESIDNIGGLNVLKDYLRRKNKVIKDLEEAQTHHVAVPKGVFIVGMPGCGKSLCAKATATLFQVPLLKMDMGSLMGKYVGQSEENIRKAIRIAEAAAPCVLWIDEIEKMFSGIGGHNDILTRMFGYFLSWLQEKKTSVYVVATANSANNLPPELKRKGRFDEIFCVNLPNETERNEIFKTHLKKRHQTHITISQPLIKATDGFNGADIEAVVNDALEECFIDNKSQLTENTLLKVAQNTIGIEKSCKKQIDDMKQIFEDSNLKNASTPPANSK